MPSRYSRRTALALLGSCLTSVGVAQADETSTTTTSTPTLPTPVGSHPTFGANPARTGHLPDEDGPDEPVAGWWCVDSSGSHRLTPLALVDGRLYTGSPSEGLRALDPATGETLWQTRFRSYPDAPTVVGDRLFTSDGTAVYAVGVESGRELWTRQLTARLWTSVLAVNGGPGDLTLFVARDRIREPNDDSNSEREPDDARLFALDGDDGSIRWTAPLDRPMYGSLAAYGDLVCGGGEFGVSAFDAATGERRWHADLEARATDPAVGDGSVVVGSDVGVVHALNPKDGREQWTFELPNAGEEEDEAGIRTSPAIADESVYVAATDGNLYALSAATGDSRWVFDGGSRLTCSPTVVGTGDDAVVYVGSGQGNVFAVDADDGTMRWSHQLTDRVETEPVVVDSAVFVGDNEGRVHALVGESVPTEGTAACRVAERETPTPQAASEDSDSDGVPDDSDYAPRDGSVQRRSDLTGGEDERLGFLSGVGVGAVVSAFGAGAGWWLGNRNEE